MKKIFTILSLLISFYIRTQAQNFGYFASAVWLKDSSYTGFFNCYDTSDASAIGTHRFSDTLLGTFPQNSGSLQIGGGEMKTFKNPAAGNVCGAALFYTVYISGSRPANPVFTTVNFGFFSNCTGGVFDVGGGPCSVGDQKWQTVSPMTDLTTLAPGSYTIEAYFRESGSSTSTSDCGDTTYDNNSNPNSNYTGSFVISQNLPVTLINFNAAYDKSSVDLNWTVANEINQKGFTIERSTNTANFSDISFIEAKGNSSSQLKYSYTDKTLPSASKVFYRLKMINNDGSATYSSMLPVSLGSVAFQFTTQLTPGKLTVHFTGTLENNSMLQLTDMQGRILMKQNLSPQQNVSSVISLPLIFTLPAGIYIVSIFDGENLLNNKVALTQ